MSDHARDEGHPGQDWQGGNPYTHRPFSSGPLQERAEGCPSGAERDEAELLAPPYTRSAGPTGAVRDEMLYGVIYKVLRSYAIPESVAGNAARAVFQALQEPLG